MNEIRTSEQNAGVEEYDLVVLGSGEAASTSPGQWPRKERSGCRRASGRNGDGVALSVRHDGQSKTITGTHMLVALGRTPNTDGLNLNVTGVKLTPAGYIQVNDRLQTTAPGVWAVGEVAGSPQFTHISYDDHRVIHANLTGKIRTPTGRQVPHSLFTDPEVARVGLN